MIYGHDSLVKDFKNLIDQKRLFHAYVFFGEPQVGKFLFAKNLANYIERGMFEEPKTILQENLIIDFSNASDTNEVGNKESVGINTIRNIEHFLYRTSATSPYRSVIVNDAEWLTNEAQNALLKILEEPPQKGVLILIARDRTTFLPTILSRVLPVYFKSLSDTQILDFLLKYGKIENDKAKQIASVSFGRIGRALNLIKGEKARLDIDKTIKQALAPRATKYQLEKAVEDILKIIDKNPLALEVFFEEIILRLRSKVVHTSTALSKINEEIKNIESLTVNKRLHIKNILWTTKSILSD